MTLEQPSTSSEDMQRPLRFVKLNEEIDGLPDGLTTMVIGHRETGHSESDPAPASRARYCDATAHLDRRRHVTQHAFVHPGGDLAAALFEGSSSVGYFRVQRSEISALRRSTKHP